jgi:hypothetical protein
MPAAGPGLCGIADHQFRFQDYALFAALVVDLKEQLFHRIDRDILDGSQTVGSTIRLSTVNF